MHLGRPAPDAPARPTNLSPTEQPAIAGSLNVTQIDANMPIGARRAGDAVVVLAARSGALVPGGYRW
jgi:hypothetical protein